MYADEPGLLVFGASLTSGSLFCAPLLFISFFGIVPLIVWNCIKNNMETVPGSGIKKLRKKGKIGNH